MYSTCVGVERVFRKAIVAVITNQDSKALLILNLHLLALVMCPAFNHIWWPFFFFFLWEKLL